VVHNGGITFDNSVHGEVATIAGIRDLLILETPDDGFDGINSGASSCQDKATSLACSVEKVKNLANINNAIQRQQNRELK
jgi:hypothetical protein